MAMLVNDPDIVTGKTKDAKALWRRKDIDGLRELARKNITRFDNEEDFFQALELDLREEQSVLRSYKCAFVQFLTLIPALAVMLLAMFLGARSIDGSATALEVLLSYQRWATTLFVACSGALLFVFVVNAFMSVKLIKSKSFTRFNVVVAAIAIGLTFFAHWLINSPLDRNAIAEDILAIENNALTTGTYWINMDSLRDDLGGIIPFMDFGERAVYRQNTRRVQGSSQLRDSVYFTEQFSPDYLRAIAGADEYQVWEQEPSRRYFVITYTPNFRLAVDIMPTTDIDR